MGVWPPEGTDERREIEDIECRLRDAGYELGLTKELETTWFASLMRSDNPGPAAAPFATGASAVEAARNAWLLYLSTPSLNSFNELSG